MKKLTKNQAKRAMETMQSMLDIAAKDLVDSIKPDGRLSLIPESQVVQRLFITPEKLEGLRERRKIPSKLHEGKRLYVWDRVMNALGKGV